MNINTAENKWQMKSSRWIISWRWMHSIQRPEPNAILNTGKKESYAFYSHCTVSIYQGGTLFLCPSTVPQDDMRPWPTFHGFCCLDELRHSTSNSLGKSSQLMLEFWGWLLKDLWVKNMLDPWGVGWCLTEVHFYWWKGTSLWRISSSREARDLPSLKDSGVEKQGCLDGSFWHSYQRSQGWPLLVLHSFYFHIKQI